MAETGSSHKAAWGRALQLLFTAALIGFAVYVLRAAVHDASDLYPFRHYLNYWWVLLAACVQILQYAADGFFVQRLFRVMGFKVSLRDTVRLGTLDAVSAAILPVGQFGSLAVAVQVYRKRGLPTQAIVFWNFSVGFITFTLLVIIFIVALALTPRGTFAVPVHSTLWSLLGLTAALAAAAVLILRQPAAHRRLEKYAWYRKARDAFDQWREYAAKIGRAWPAFAGLVVAKVLVYYALDIATIECCFLAFHTLPHLALVATAYFVSLVAGYVAMTPAGLGATDATLTAVLVGGGVSPSAVVGMLLLYRLVATVLPTPLGAWSLYSLRREGAITAAA